jgi:hypothetical protein
MRAGACAFKRTLNNVKMRNSDENFHAKLTTEHGEEIK